MKKATELILEKIPTDLFTASDMVNVLGGSENSRYSLVKRMIADGDIIRICRGIYCLAPKYRRYEMDLYSIALHVYGPSYVSFESALSYHGWIPEAVYTLTNACMKKSKEFDTPLGLFSFKRIPSIVFYSQVERVEGTKNNIFFMAQPFKALLDYIYIYKKNWKCLGPAVESLRIDPDSFKDVGLEDLDELQQQYRSCRVQEFIKGARREIVRL